MKKITSIILVISLVIVSTFNISADADDQILDTDVAEIAVESDEYIQEILSEYTKRFEGNTEKQQEFLQKVLQKEDEGVAIEISVLEKIYIDMMGMNDQNLPIIINQETFENPVKTEDDIICRSQAEKDFIRENNLRTMEDVDVPIAAENDGITEQGIIETESQVEKFNIAEERQSSQLIGFDQDIMINAKPNSAIHSDSLSKAPMISAGAYHNVYLKADGTVWTWGEYKTDLYTAAIDIYTKPTKVEGLSSIIEVSAGGAHSLALKSDGTVWAWGLNNFGQLGDNTNVDHQIPVQVLDTSNTSGKLTGVIAIAAGYYHNLAIKSDGTVVSWGCNIYGQLGNGFIINSGLCVKVSLLSDVISISAGQYHSLALKSDGTIFSWGYNANGQLGDNTTTTRDTPVQVKGENGSNYLTMVTSIAAGCNHSLAIISNGFVFSWGSNNNGQLGEKTFTDRHSPALVWGVNDAPGLTNMAAIAADGAHSLALDSDGSVYGWGYNSMGLLGYGSLAPGLSCFNYNIPAKSNISSVISISTGVEHSIAMKSDGNIWVVGSNANYQFGSGWEKRSLPDIVYMTGTADKIVSGSNHNLILKSDGTVYMWGESGGGSEYDIGNISTPTQVKGENGVGYLNGVIEVEAGSNHSLALKYDGSVWAWGNNFCGQLGDNTTIDKANPVQVKGENGIGYLTDIIAITAGDLYNLALKADGTVWAWGNNLSGELGDNTVAEKLSPVQVKNEEGTGYLTGIIAISADFTHSLALKSNGTVLTWGDNSYGQLGDNTTTNRYIPAQVKDANGTNCLSNVAKIEAGCRYSLALKDDGTVWAWGCNEDGELGDNTAINKLSPVQVKGENGIGNLVEIIAISTGKRHSLALKSDGTVWAWGYNLYGQLGDNTAINKLSPTQVKDQDGVGYLTDVIAISSGDNHNIALKYNKTVFAWGNNNCGQLGNSINPFSFAWIRSLSPTNGPVQVKVGRSYYHSLLLNSDGSVWAAGNNTKGQLGDGTTVNSTSPIRVKDAEGTGYLSGIVEVAAGGYHSIALKYDGTVFAWGTNWGGQLGNGTTEQALLPITVKKGYGGECMSSVVSIAAGNNYSIALKADGTVWAWGYNPYGQLGDETLVQKNFPVQVKGENGIGYLTDVVSIAGGGNHNLAVKSDGSVWTWGYNAYGQLGDNTTANKSTPVQVKGEDGIGNLTGIIAVSAGDHHSLALKSDGTVYAWGYNEYGQLGDNTTVNKGIPIKVKGVNGIGYMTEVSTISAGAYSNVCIKSAGTVYAWGYNQNGQIGDGTTTGHKFIPIMLPVNNLSYISGGYHNTFAIKTDGTILAWGNNQDGAFGIGSSENIARTPVNAYTSNVVYDDCGNNFADAVQIIPSLLTMGEINYEGDTDYFVFTANMGGEFSIESTGNVTIGIYNADKTLMTIANTFELTCEQRYYIMVSGTVGSYTFKLNPTHKVLFIDKVTLLSGITGNTPIQTLQQGFVRTKVSVLNVDAAQRNIVLIVSLINKQNNACHEIIMTEKTIQSRKSEDVLVGFNVPSDAQNYKIEILVWDDMTNMALLDKVIL